MTAPGELSSLKNEVAELWRRFKSEEPASAGQDDPARKALVEQIKTLDVKQKELMVKRDSLRHELEVERARIAGRAPGFRALGLILGVLVGVACAIGAMPSVAEFTIALSK
ncbi:MAG: hypothetical protein JNM17_10495 [Archangium sp.]|nr:hypothetical protein [Archangium sp.]